MKRVEAGEAVELTAQPPSGGCVLKQGLWNGLKSKFDQPPSGGCVLKLFSRLPEIIRSPQPPSGGCVLKHGQYE